MLMSAQLHFALLRRPLVLWLAVLISVFGALAPTLSHAFALARGDAAPMVQVCTSTGAREVAITMATDSPDAQESAPALAHCPFCLLATDRAAPPPSAFIHCFGASGESGLATVRQVVFNFAHFALTPPPRGPPPVFWVI